MIRRLLIVAVLLALCASPHAQTRVGTFGTAVGVPRSAVTPPTANLLTLSDLTCDGVFWLPPNSGGLDTPIGLDYRYDGATRTFYVTDYNGNIWEISDPGVTSGCDNAAVHPSDWAGPVSSLIGYVAGTPIGSSNTAHNCGSGFTGNCHGRNVNYLPSLDWLCGTWIDTYGVGTANPENTFGCVDRNGGGATSVIGCWGIDGVPGGVFSWGILELPSYFVSAHGLGTKTWGIMGGGWGTSANRNTMGPTLIAIDPPSSNPCTANTDTLLSGTTLWQYSSPRAQPSPLSGALYAQVPTDDYNATAASYGWVPVSGQGYAPGSGYNFTGGRFFEWVKNDAVEGIFVAFRMTTGTLSTTIAAGPPSPTSSTAKLTSVTYTDSSNVQAGDVLIVGVDSGGDAQCGKAIYRVDSVNTGTNVVTWTALSTAGTHSAGNSVDAGASYCMAGPLSSRDHYWYQIFDPAQLGDVADGTGRQPYEVTPSESGAFLPPYYGTSIRPGWSTAGESENQQIVGMRFDATANQLFVLLRNVRTTGGSVVAMVIRYTVRSS